ncbi:glycosyltransferase [Flavobacterium jejuense]|uniref:dolichyl-phosphate beta-glucosyltransferase n=1 Tax=Flavobacterium jejuense TaxID=1544455 RepID=A0ABX0IXW8_9FLAO|nr:glycosyltransferase [Flavobacterium jejuense]NHN26619.1 glycosyltransferase [Flavobacterium jejuense]
MKILVIDDQDLVLLSLEKSLTDLGYDVITAKSVTNGILKYDNHLPDLVLVDINIPENENDVVKNNHELVSSASGLDIVEHIKVIRESNTPVMILSGNTDETIIERGFTLGAEDYMKKPLSLTEIGLRVKRLIGSGTIYKVEQESQLLQKGVIGVVIPCYNEEERLQSEAFKKFINRNLGYHLCFVNDGSKDNTLNLLNELAKGNEERISVYDCEKNGGKAEAVRLGMLHLAKDQQFDYIGFLDADLSTNFDDFQDLVTTISNSNFQIVSGSRMSRMGADITKESARAIISKTINFIIRKTLGMEINDTQCGAKIMTKEIIEKTFQTRFLTKWLFDVEIFMRMKKVYGSKEAKELICEQPLKRWIHADGSKLSMKDSVKIVGQIGQIAISYR